MSQVVQLEGNVSVLWEQADSPQWEFGDKVQATVRYRGTYALCLSTAPRKGALGTGPYSGGAVTSAKVKREKGGLAELVIIYEGNLMVGGGGSTQVPADEPDVDLEKVEFALEKHPRYELAFADDEECAAARKYVESTNDDDRNAFQWILDQGDPLIVEFVSKLQRGQTHFAVWVPVYTWTLYYLDEPTLDPGSYPEDPFGPITAPLGWEWLRRGDKLTWNGSYWKLTRSWQGAVTVDGDIYPIEPA